jgi:hypothetical protein
MRRHEILTRAILILSIINIALSAPVAVREGPEVRLDAKVTRNVKAASQQRRDLLDEPESGSTNVPGPDHAPPPSPDSTDSTLWQQIDFSPPYSPDVPGTITGWHPPSPGSPTGSRLSVGSMPVAGSPSLSPPPPAPESGSTNMPRPDYAPPSSPDSIDSILQQVDLSPPYSPDRLGSLKGWSYVPPSLGSPTESRLPVGSMPRAGSSSLSPPPGPESGSTNMLGPDHASPSSPDSTNSILQQIDLSPPYSPDSLGSLKGWHYVPPSLGSPTESRLSVGSTPVVGSLSPPPPESAAESGLTNVPWQDHAPPSSPDSTDSIWWQTDRTPPHSSDGLGSLAEWNYVPPSPGSPTGSRLSVGSMPMASSLSPPPPPPIHSNQPGASEDHFRSPPGLSANPDTLSSTGSQSTPPQGPEVDEEMDLENFPIEIWDDILTGKIERRISGSDSLNLAQKDRRSRISGHEYFNLDDLPQFDGSGL